MDSETKTTVARAAEGQRATFDTEGDPESARVVEPSWPCVGDMRASADVRFAERPVSR